MLTRLILLLLVPLLSGCQSVGFFVANLPNSFADTTRHSNMAYGENQSHTWDIYIPSNTSTPPPVVVFLYGGGWSSGNKENYGFVAHNLIKQGFAVVIPDYQKYPPALYPDFVKDIALATRWVKDNIHNYGADANSLHLLGHSAGAHTGAMLMADKQYLKAQQLTPNVYKSFAGLAGPYHFTPEEEKYIAIFGPPERYATMHAANYIDGTEPPMLLLHGTDDDIVDVRNLQTLQSAIEKQGGIVTSKLYSNTDHIGIIASFSSAFNFENTSPQDVASFFTSHH